MIWITGCGGMLGRDMAQRFDESGLGYIGTDIEVDITDRPAVSRFLGGNEIDWIVNCAGYTAVDTAEEEPEKAMKLNARGPENLAEEAGRRGIRLIHFSTDYIFGKTGDRLINIRPLKEDDPAEPVCVYGKTKFAGEEAVRGSGAEHFIFRISWLYGKYGKNFVSTMLRLFREKTHLRVVDDQYGCPTWTEGVTRLCEKIIKDGSGAFGTYHYCGAGSTTWHGFALEIARFAKKYGMIQTIPDIEPCGSGEYPSKAERPAWSVLSTAETVSTFGIDIDDWKTALDRSFGTINR